MLDRVVLIGRVAKDADIEYAGGNGAAVSDFTLALDRDSTAKDEDKAVEFISVVLQRKVAEKCGDYLREGSLVAVEGRVQVRPYDKDGVDRRLLAIVVGDNVRFLDGNKGDKD